MKFYLKAIMFLIVGFSFIPLVFGQYSANKEILLAGDAVRIQIWELGRSGENPIVNLNGDYVIDPDGNIVMPFVGLVKVSGRTPSEIGTLVLTKYADFLQDPFIYTRPLMRVTLAGSILRPGAYRIDPQRSLWDLLELAGGPSSEAELKKMNVMRGGEIVVEDLLNAFENAYSIKEMGIQSGDQIYVPARGGISVRDVVDYLHFAASVVLLYLRLQNQNK